MKGKIAPFAKLPPQNNATVAAKYGAEGVVRLRGRPTAHQSDSVGSEDGGGAGGSSQLWHRRCRATGRGAASRLSAWETRNRAKV